MPKKEEFWFKEGECFVCRKPCHRDGYAHFECCMSLYEEIKKKHAKMPKKRIWEDFKGEIKKNAQNSK